MDACYCIGYSFELAQSSTLESVSLQPVDGYFVSIHETDSRVDAFLTQIGYVYECEVIFQLQPIVVERYTLFTCGNMGCRCR